MRLGSIVIAALALSLGACAGKPLQIHCAGFADQLVDLPDNDVVRSVHTDDGWAGDPSQLQPLTRERLRSYLKSQIEGSSWVKAQVQSMKKQLQSQLQNQPAAIGAKQDGGGEEGSWFERPVLMLSGGGQWGAYGAGFMQEALKKPGGLPHFRIVTGVSTGAMQSLFFANWRDEAGRGEALRQMNAAYDINDESDIVKRGGFTALVSKGAMADLGPLYQRIIDQLCPADKPDCPMVQAFRTPKSAYGDFPDMIFVGMVDAASGKFKYVSLNALVDAQFSAPADPQDPRPAPQRAAQCLAGAVLASSAMPGYYQQIQVGEPARADRPNSGYKTYLDGGARASIFMATISKTYSPGVLIPLLYEEVRKDGYELPDPSEDELDQMDAVTNFYVVRNGPTQVREMAEDKRDQPWSGIDAMQRGYEIMVNQSEVNSIAAIRLVQPFAPVRLTTADGFGLYSNGKTRCEKRDPKAMFDPDFMRCLAKLGADKAAIKGWFPVDTVKPAGGG